MGRPTIGSAAPGCGRRPASGPCRWSTPTPPTSSRSPAADDLPTNIVRMEFSAGQAADSQLCLWRNGPRRPTRSMVTVIFVLLSWETCAATARAAEAPEPLASTDDLRQLFRD